MMAEVKYGPETSPRPKIWMFGHMDPDRWDCCQNIKTCAKISMCAHQMRLCTGLGPAKRCCAGAGSLYPGNNPICVDPYDQHQSIGLALGLGLPTPPTSPRPPDELSIPGQAPLPSRPGTKYVAQGTLAAMMFQADAKDRWPLIAAGP